MLLTVVIPVYFNAESLAPLWQALAAALLELPPGLEWEVVFVDDGSGDGSFAELERLHREGGGRVRVARLTRNFGQVPAIHAGLRLARGDACVVLSADLQDPPGLIPEMARRWNGGATKIVLAARSAREDGLIARGTSRAFYRLMRRYAVPNMPEGGFDFFLIDRRVVDIMNALDEKNSFIQGMILWTGFRPEILSYTRLRRPHGRSRWTLSRKVKYFVDGFVTYTVAPIRLITLIGLGVSLLSFGYAALILALRLLWGLPVEGWAPTMISLLGLSGVQLVMLGIIGEYLWRNYYETRKLPSFVIDSVLEAPDQRHV